MKLVIDKQKQMDEIFMIASRLRNGDVKFDCTPIWTNLMAVKESILEIRSKDQSRIKDNVQIRKYDEDKEESLEIANFKISLCSSEIQRESGL